MLQFKDLTLTQKAMVLGYKYRFTIPFLETHVQQLHKKEVQDNYAKMQKELIGDAEARRKYWLARLALSS